MIIPRNQKRKGDGSTIDIQGLANAEYIRYLQAKYTNMVYTWASPYLMNLAFEALLSLAPNRMLMQTRSGNGRLHGLVLGNLRPSFVDGDGGGTWARK